MYYEHLFNHLNQILPISDGFIEYLKVALFELHIRKNERLKKDHHIPFPFTFIASGIFKTTLESKLDPGKSLVEFHFEKTLLITFDEHHQDDYSLETISMSESNLLLLPAKHIYNLHRLFPEFHLLIEQINKNQLSKLFHLAFDIKNLKAEDRLAELLKIHPDIFQLASSIDIAQSIGIHSHTLSSIKRKHLNR